MNIPKKLASAPNDFFSSRTWYQKTLAGHPITLSVQVLAALSEIAKNFDFKTYNWGGLFVEGTEWNYFWDAKDLERIRTILLERIQVSSGVTDEIANLFFSRWTAFEKKTVDANSVDVTNLSDDELADWLIDLVDSEIEVGAVGYIVDCFLNTGESDWMVDAIRNEIQDLPKEEQASVIIALTAPTERPFVNRERLSMLEILQQIIVHPQAQGLIGNASAESLQTELQQYPELYALLTKHRDHFYWVHNNYITSANLTEIDFLRKSLSFFENLSNIPTLLEEEEQRIRKNKAKQSELIAEYGISKAVQNIIEAGQVFAHVQDTRKQGVQMLTHFILKAVAEYSRRKNVPTEDLKLLTIWEFEDYMRTGAIDLEEVARRRKGIFMYLEPNAYALYSGEKYQNIDRSIFFPKVSEVSELKGVPASKGIVAGIVRILKTAAQIDELQDGEILVTNNTTPEFVPAMKKAVAIVTEQGGITTHAAVVSRELGVTCVIGVTNATELLKTGDKIEVNGDTGVITKL